MPNNEHQAKPHFHPREKGKGAIGLIAPLFVAGGLYILFKIAVIEVVVTPVFFLIEDVLTR